MAEMRLLARASAAGLICCALPALAQTMTEPAPERLIPGVPAEPPDVARWRAVFSPFAVHFSYSSIHKPVVLFGMERERPDGIVWGGAIFSNSFGQPSAYAFGGQRLYGWSPWAPLYAEWSAGLLYGYVGQYKNKVPLNYNGFSPGLVGGLGWQFTPKFAGQINLLGSSGLIVMMSIELP
jgi:hypothetical protein